MLLSHISHIAIAAIGSSHDCWLVALYQVVSVDVGLLLMTPIMLIVLLLVCHITNANVGLSHCW